MKPPPDLMEEWLRQFLPQESTASGLLDVGGYHGDFTAALLASGVCQRAWVFEPNPASRAHLLARFPEDGPVRIIPTAVGAQTRRMRLKRSGHPSTASLLDYADPASAATADAVEVDCTTLDDWWQSNDRPAVRVLKIDTQGHDLAVLEGAGKLLAAHRPCLVVELIFSALYTGQCTPAEIFAWTGRQGYRVAGFFNEHYSEAGLLAFADAVLVPVEQVVPDTVNYNARPSTLLLQQQVVDLTKVCEERLALINSIHAEAEKRLAIIRQLQGNLGG